MYEARKVQKVNCMHCHESLRHHLQNRLTSFMTVKVQWYQSSGGANAYGGGSLGENDFSYDAPSTSAGNFGTFEEEEPLLQGKYAITFYILDFYLPVILILCSFYAHQVAEEALRDLTFEIWEPNIMWIPDILWQKRYFGR